MKYIATLFLAILLFVGGCNTTPAATTQASEDTKFIQGNQQLATILSQQSQKLDELNAKIAAVTSTLTQTQATAAAASSDVSAVKDQLSVVSAKNQALTPPLDWLTSFVTTSTTNLANAIAKLETIKSNLSEAKASQAVITSNASDLTKNNSQAVVVQKDTQTAGNNIITEKNNIQAQLDEAKSAGRKELLDKIHWAMFIVFCVSGATAILGFVLLGFAPTAKIGEYVAGFGTLIFLLDLTLITFEGIITTVLLVLFFVALGLAVVAGGVLGYKWWVTHKALTENINLTSMLRNEVPKVEKYFEGPTPIAHLYQSPTTREITKSILNVIDDPKPSPLASSATTP